MNIFLNLGPKYLIFCAEVDGEQWVIHREFEGKCCDIINSGTMLMTLYSIRGHNDSGV